MDHGSASKSGWESYMADTEVARVADKKQPMGMYWPTFRMRAYVIFSAVQSIAILIIFIALELLGITHAGWLLVVCLVIVTAALFNGITILLLRLLSKPFHDLVQAIVLVTGEPTSETPP